MSDVLCELCGMPLPKGEEMFHFHGYSGPCPKPLQAQKSGGEMYHRKRIYIAGPISKGDLRENIRRACYVGRKLMDFGFAPLVPHLTCYMGGDNPEVLPLGTTHADWYGIDLPWVEVADAVFRLPGESVGADLEVAHAQTKGIPVYTDIETLINELSPTP